MVGSAVALWLALATQPALETGDTLAPGLYPAAVLCGALQAVDGLPTVAANAGLGSTPVRIYAPIEVSERTHAILKIALRVSGLHRIVYDDVRGNAFAYLTRDPRKRPVNELGFGVEIWRVTHLEIEIAARILNETAAQREAELPKDAVRTVFVADARTGRLIVRFGREETLAQCRDLLRTVDVPRKDKKDQPSLRHWDPRYRAAEELAQELERRWKRDGSGAELFLVVSEATGTLLLRLAEKDWERVQALLEEIDVPPQRPTFPPK